MTKLTNKQKLDNRLLRLSIAHWERMRDRKGGDQPSASQCALCREYFWCSECDGCPIFERTKRKGCEGTPYQKAMLAFWENRRTFPSHAQAMIDFLRSLLVKRGGAQ